jgi:hypothetical protein
MWRMSSQAKVPFITVSLICTVLSALGLTPLFQDKSGEWGLAKPNVYGDSKSTRFLIETTGTGVAILDVDGDRKNDLLILNGARIGEKQEYPPLLYKNLGGGKFEEAGAKSGLAGGGWAQAACSGDIDNDGDVDLWITYYGVSRLFLNQGKRFEDVTAKRGLPATGLRWGSGCAMVDYDRDGRLDLFVANYVDIEMEKSPKPGSMPECMWKDTPVACGPRGLPKGRNYLYRQLADGRFEDASARAGIWKPGGRYGLGVTAADFNNDGWPDIYVACDQTPSLLYQNLGNGTFKERAMEAGVAYDANGRAQAGMGVAVGDFDGNGMLDIAKTNFSGDLPSLYLNEDGSFFRDTAEAAGLGKHLLLGWGIAFYDHDEDGRPDLILANGHVYPEVDRAKFGETYRQPTLLYRNLGGGRFEDLSARAGQALLRPKASRGLAVGDLDGDGRPELVIANMNESPSVLQRDGVRGNLLRVTLEGTRSNRSAIGARVTVEAGKARYIAELSSGGSYYSQHESALYFGLGAATTVDRVTVRWPRGTTEIWQNVDPAKSLHLIEGKAP